MTVVNDWLLAAGHPATASGGSSRSALTAAVKKVGKAGALAASPGVTVAQTATHMPSLALVAAGAAASATGIGLIVVGAAATLTVSSLAAAAAYKSWQHCKALDAIYERRTCYGCARVRAGDSKDVDGHNEVANVVLPYICLQKSEKVARKTVGAVPGLGLGETVYAIGRAAYKGLRGTKGKVRNEMAGKLAKHLITHNCGLAQAIVADLYGFEQMTWILKQNYDDVVTLLAEKMASR